jgi:hypothetical protein
MKKITQIKWQRLFINQQCNYSSIRFTSGYNSNSNATTTSNQQQQDKPLIVDIVSHNNLTNKPLVCLFGWLGANHKHFQKYIDWYTKCNMDCISIIPPFHSILNERVAIRTANQFVTEIEKHIDKVPNVPIVFHTLSGNGLNMYGHVIQNQLFTQNEVRESVKGLICDSTPPVITTERLTHGFVGTIQSVTGTKPTDFTYSLLYNTLTPITRTLFRLYLESPGNHKQRIEVFREKVVRIQPDCSQLFISSDKDTIVPPQDIEYFIQFEQDIRKKMNLPPLDCERLHFTNSDHVAHFRKYPFEYSSAILKFISRNLLIMNHQSSTHG